ncbi:hypothetical protein CAPTEDRAFT_210076 [Capitella teleta]|uniref:Uncharacterized protein n=1 Tax=Capitella teleta TaxID=283909 RepID=R7TJ81_CAPTE|nr:hypothetical protein CAPTEDRAFT_210076 [Capitella teleta]|eukprot:ELT93858.1 hypothetical protein CAPTEDRAFT_210076 [Capitella teleta]
MDSATSSISVDDLQSAVGKTFTSYEELENFIDEIETAINLVISVVDSRTIEVGMPTNNMDEDDMDEESPEEDVTSETGPKKAKSETKQPLGDYYRDFYFFTCRMQHRNYGSASTQSSIQMVRGKNKNVEDKVCPIHKHSFAIKAAAVYVSITQFECISSFLKPALP